MLDETYSHPSLNEIISREGNGFCFDCGTENPKWASINNGIHYLFIKSYLYYVLNVQVFIEDLVFRYQQYVHYKLILGQKNK